ncbi:hypothetical protein [Bradyrhizobium paxllaeri]|uniref:hypothetical protein n=1 Tax=Bradyrhizobium paxllaeri TaxID=190148 RepID=UPI000810A003|nr:hypothetical protein [Bradyrhizobium paxllaeri]
MLTKLATLLKVSFKFRDDDVYQARGKWIGDFPFQKPIAFDLSFKLSELALCHDACPLANRRLAGQVVSQEFSDNFLWFLSCESVPACRGISTPMGRFEGARLPTFEFPGLTPLAERD